MVCSEKIGPKPNWLGRVEQVEKVDESDDLENWLEENLELLPTLLDVDSAPPRGSSPSHGRRSARDQYQGDEINLIMQCFHHRIYEWIFVITTFLLANSQINIRQMQHQKWITITSQRIWELKRLGLP